VENFSPKKGNGRKFEWKHDYKTPSKVTRGLFSPHYLALSKWVRYVVKKSLFIPSQEGILCNYHKGKNLQRYRQ
jgi:hypothetical protein